MTRRPRLLVLRPLGLGDFLTAVPAFRAVAAAFSDHERILAAPAYLHELLPLIPGCFDRAIDARPLEPLPPALDDVDVAIDLHGRGPASHRILLALRPKRLIAFANPSVPESRDGAAFVEEEHEVSRWCRMLEHAGIATGSRTLELAVPETPSPFPGATIVHAGAASESRRWPIERWAAVIRHCTAAGERVVLTGDRSERERTTALAQLAGLAPDVNLAGVTSLNELCALVAHAARVLVADTGNAHIASAYSTPSVVLFGPTPPARWGPPPRAHHRVLWAGRSGDPHGTVVDAGLMTIAPGDVIAQIAFASVTAGVR